MFYNHKSLLKVNILEICTHVKEKKGLLNVHIEDQGNNYNLQFQQKSIAKVDAFTMFECTTTDIFEVQLETDNFSGYAKFPLKNLCGITRVKHCIEVIIILKKDKQIVKPIKQVATLQLEITVIDGLMGELTISMIQGELSRNCDLVGKMDPYVVLNYENQVMKTGVRDNQGMRPIWNSKFIFKIRNLSSMLKIDVYDEDNIKDDIVGSKQINFLRQGLLVPDGQFKSHKVHIMYDGQSAGILKLQYKFTIQSYIND